MAKVDNTTLAMGAGAVVVFAVVGATIKKRGDDLLERQSAITEDVISHYFATRTDLPQERRDVLTKELVKRLA